MPAIPTSPTFRQKGNMGEEVDRYIKALNEEKARSAAEKQALIEEFSKSIPAEWSPDDLKEKFRELLAKSYARISQTIDDDDEKALAFQAAKYVTQIGIGATKITDANDPNKELKELFESLKPKKTETALPSSSGGIKEPTKDS